MLVTIGDRRFQTLAQTKLPSLVRSNISTLALTAIPIDKTIPATPESVSTACNEAKIPIVKNKLHITPKLAIRPGGAPYIMII